MLLPFDPSLFVEIAARIGAASRSSNGAPVLAA
jgi:hypothetical protein